MKDNSRWKIGKQIALPGSKAKEKERGLDLWLSTEDQIRKFANYIVLFNRHQACLKNDDPVVTA